MVPYHSVRRGADSSGVSDRHKSFSRPTDVTRQSVRRRNIGWPIEAITGSHFHQIVVRHWRRLTSLSYEPIAAVRDGGQKGGTQRIVGRHGPTPTVNGPAHTIYACAVEQSVIKEDID